MRKPLAIAAAHVIRHGRLLRVSVLALALLAGAAAPAVEYYVNNVTGQDGFDGREPEAAGKDRGPFRTVRRAIRAAQAGDTIHLAPTGELYREIADFYGHAGGQPGKPVTLDGHGATLSGAEPCPPEGWQPGRDGVLMRTNLISQGFMLIDGQMVFETLAFNVLQPGEFCYMPNLFNRLCFYPPPGKALGDFEIEVGQPEEKTARLDPAKWSPSHSRIGAVRRYEGLQTPTWVKCNGVTVPLVTAKERLEPNQWCAEAGVLYYRPPPDREIDQLAIGCVVRANGVQLNGDTAHVVIRNLNVQHVYNDGYNVHGHVTNAEFSNCNARQSGDEGFSAHGECETVLDGALYEECDNGIANVNTAGQSITRNVVIRNCRSVGYLLEHKGTARHELRDSILIDNPSQFAAGNLMADNVLIVRTPSPNAPKTTALQCGAETTLRRVTALGNTGLLRAGAGAKVAIEDCWFGPGQHGVHVRAADPRPILELNGVSVAPDLVIEWGARYPWTTRPLTNWLAQAEAAGKAHKITVSEAGLDEALGKSAPTNGCSRVLIERFQGLSR